jgi:hypothetical protein
MIIALVIAIVVPSLDDSFKLALNECLDGIERTSLLQASLTDGAVDGQHIVLGSPQFQFPLRVLSVMNHSLNVLFNS